MSTSCLDIHFDIDSEGRVRTKFGDKIYDFILNVTFICSNIPAEPAFGVYISQLIRYSKTWSSIHGLVDGGLQ